MNGITDTIQKCTLHLFLNDTKKSYDSYNLLFPLEPCFFQASFIFGVESIFLTSVNEITRGKMAVDLDDREPKCPLLLQLQL